MTTELVGHMTIVKSSTQQPIEFYLRVEDSGQLMCRLCSSSVGFSNLVMMRLCICATVVGQPPPPYDTERGRRGRGNSKIYAK